MWTGATFRPPVLLKGIIWNGTKMSDHSTKASLFNKIKFFSCNVFLQIVLVQELSQVVPDFASRWQHMPLDLRGDAAFQEGRGRGAGGMA